MDVTTWIERYGRAWRERDAEGITRIFTDDALYRSSPTGPPHRGVDGIASYWEDATRTQEALDLRFGRPVVDGDRAVVEWWATMRDPDWFPEAGSPEVTLPGALVLRFAADGRCSELREYYNPLPGASVDPPDGWGD